MVTKAKTKSKAKKIVGRPLTTSLMAFKKRYTVIKYLRNGMVVHDKRTGRDLKVYGDKKGRTVIEPYTSSY